MGELALFPPLARFFITILLIAVVIGTEVLVSYIIFTLYKRSESEGE
jgi:hypothetical protein